MKKVVFTIALGLCAATLSNAQLLASIAPVKVGTNSPFAVASWASTEINLGSIEQGKPLILKISYDKEQKAVIVKWDYTSSAISHFVLYRSENEQGLSQFHAIDGKNREYIDKEIKLDGRYEYAIRAFTTQGNLSNLSQKVQWTNK